MKSILSRNGGINEMLVRLGWIESHEAVDWMAFSIDLNPLLKSLGLIEHTNLDLMTPPGFLATVVLMALYLYPITFLNVQAALANIDPALDEAGQNLGAGAWRRFWRITLPLMRPGVFAGSTIVFIWAFTELGTPLMVGWEQVTAVQVFRMLQTSNPGPDAYALVVVLLVSSVMMYLVGKLVLGRRSGAMMAKATVAQEPTKLGLGKSVLITLPFLVVFVLAVLPHFGVLLNSVSATGQLELSPSKMTGEYHSELVNDVVNFQEAGRGLAATSIGNSFVYAIWATVIDIGLGFLIAYLVVRKRSWLNGLLDNLAMLPLAVPGLVMAFGYFALTQPGSMVSTLLDPVIVPPLKLLSWIGIDLLGGSDSFFATLNPIPEENDPTLLLVIAYAVRRMPFMVRSCAAGLEQTSEALEEAARNLGAGPVRTMFTVTIPLLAANFIAGGLLVFSRSMLEVSDSLILAFDRKDYPMTKAILDLSEQPATGIPMASALGVWGMVILTVTIVGSSLAIGKRLGALFRV
jgi:iron(III) transport system permease protein